MQGEKARFVDPSGPKLSTKEQLSLFRSWIRKFSNRILKATEHAQYGNFIRSDLHKYELNKYVHITANVTVSLQCIPFASLLFQNTVSHVRRTLHTITCLFFPYHKYEGIFAKMISL